MVGLQPQWRPPSTSIELSMDNNSVTPESSAKLEKARARMASIPSEIQDRILRHLKATGWLYSAAKMLSVDANKSPIPWYTYSAISFLERRIKPNFSVFEFGSGHSTLWWAERTQQVTAVEHNTDWFARMKVRLPKHVDYKMVRLKHYNKTTRTENGDYSRVAQRCDRRFNVIVIDGRDRVNCARNSLSALTTDGVIVWDNSDRQRYEAGYDILYANGFRRIEFAGPGPINVPPWETSIFYRDDNCMNI